MQFLLKGMYIYNEHSIFLISKSMATQHSYVYCIAEFENIFKMDFLHYKQKVER